MQNKITEILNSKLNIEKNDIINIIRLNSLTNSNYKVETKKGDFIVRLAGEATKNVINRKDEKNNILLANKLNLESELLYFDIKTGLKISKFLSNCITLTPSLAKENENMKNIAKSLYNLHNCNINMCCSFNIIEKLNLYEKECVKLGKVFSKEYFELKNKILNLYEKYKQFGKLCPCHNDLIAENILKDKINNKIYIVDWEYAGINDFMWDIASCSLEWNMNKNDEFLFLTYYLDKTPNKIDVEKLTFYKVIQDFIWYLWSEIKIYSGENLKEYSQQRMSNLKCNLELL